MRRRQQWLLALAAFVAVALVCLYLFEDIRLRADERAYLAALADNGLTLPEASTDNVAPSEGTSSVLPDKVAAFMERWEERFPYTEPNIGPEGTVDGIDVFNDTFRVFDDTFKAFHRQPYEDNIDCEALRESLAPHDDLLHELHALAGDLARTMVPDEEDPPLNRHFARTSEMMHLLMLASTAHLCNGDAASAADELLVRNVLYEPLGLSRWYGPPDLVLSLRLTHFPVEALPRTKVYAFVAVLNREDRDARKRCEMARILNGTLRRLDAMGIGGGRTWSEYAPERRWYHNIIEGTPIESPLIQRDRLAMLGAAARIASTLDQPYPKTMAVVQNEQAAFEHRMRLLASTCAEMGSVIRKETRGAACRDLKILSLLVRHAGGPSHEYPPDLASLASDYGLDLPMDAFTGRPYRYVVEGGEFALYSVGENGVDDGGAGDDIVWQTLK